MIFAHIPSGYLLARGFVKKYHWPRYLLWVGMIAGTTPDIDIPYSLAIHHTLLHHRFYFTHFPIVWILVGAIGFLLIKLFDRPSWKPAWIVFVSGVFLHLLLDTLVGPVYWLAPFSSIEFQIFRIPDLGGWWLWSDMLNWTFLFEILIIGGAAIDFFLGGYRDVFFLPWKHKKNQT